MRIALISGAKTIDEGALKGTAAYVSSLGAALKELGHEVHIFRTETVRRSEYRRIDDVHYHIINTDNRAASSHPLCEAVVYYLSETQGVAGRFDVVHAHHRALLPVLDEVRARYQAKVYLSLHSDAGLVGRNGSTNDPNWGLITILSRMMTSSRVLRDRISDRLALDPQWIEIMYPGIDLKKYSRWIDPRKVKQQAGFNADDRLILFVGELARSHGPDILLEAVFEVIQEFPSARLVFIGDGPMGPYLKERSKVLGIFHNVRFLNFPQEDQVIDLYNACDIVCMPARNARVDQTLLEAWCAGKPVIISQSAVPEFMEPFANGLATRPEVAAVVQDILLCLREGGVAAHLGHQGWQKVYHELSWAAIARKCQQIYQENGNGRKAS